MSEKILTGPKIFLKRLGEINLEVPEVLLINPDIDSVAKAKPNKIIIGRLDGTSYYDFTKESLKKLSVTKA